MQNLWICDAIADFLNGPSMRLQLFQQQLHRAQISTDAAFSSRA